MSSPAAGAAGGDVLPALPPIKTRAAAPEHASASASPSTASVHAEPVPAVAVVVVEEEEVTEPTTTAAEEEVEEAEPRTPTSEESKLRPPTECPPAPRKPAWTATPAPRTRTSSAAAKRRLYFDVPRDLSAVFRSLPPKKRIRAPPCSAPCRPRCGSARADGSAL